MAEFLYGNNLNSALENLFESSKKSLILISPYIKLHQRYISVLRSKKDDPKIEVKIVFGKNAEDITKSINYDDFGFLKEFPNIEIRYEKRLHAKYYANESESILASMNLYSYSHDNNIEAGVRFKNYLLSDLTGKSSDTKAWEYFNRVIAQSNLLFKRIPEFESALMGLTKKYKGSKTAIDNLSKLFSINTSLSKPKNDPIADKQDISEDGYCIRTGKRIPFNLAMPMSAEAYILWKQSNKKDYLEKFCHFSGELAEGEVSFGRPVLKRYWSRVNEKRKT